MASLLWVEPSRAQTDHDAGVDAGGGEAPRIKEAVHVEIPDAGRPARAAASAAAATPAPPTVPSIAAEASAPDLGSAASFAAESFGGAAAATDLSLHLYGDTGMEVRDNAQIPWQTANSNANSYAPHQNWSFFAERLDLFGSANIERLSFLTEIMFEGYSNSIGVDVERMQVSYLVAEWLRVTAGRSHNAWGYYMDTYHHGNIFELTTGHPYASNFEDSAGIVMAHIVGVGIDGTFNVGSGQIRYDVQVGNPRSADITAVPVEYAEGSSPAVNVRLRWIPIDGLIVGVNAMRDVIPTLAAMGATTRPQIEELVGGAHIVYTEHHFLIDTEGFTMRHNPVSGVPSSDLYGAFAEIGYTLGAFTPYVRPEWLHFPGGTTPDPVFQYTTADAQGATVGQNSDYAGIQNLVDLRVGVRWMVVPQLALKLEGDRLGLDGRHMDYITAKVAFGF